MHFFYPYFLFALLVLVIPILIHLFYFRRYKKVYFPNTAFLKEIKEQKSTLENLKKKLILASRLLALLFLILAFAQPFIGKKKTEQKSGNIAACVYIDNSYSSQLKYASANVLDMQIEKAREFAASLSMEDKLYLITNDANANKGWANKLDFLNALDNIKPSAYGKNIEDVLSRQNSILNNITAQQKWRILLSDFQKNIVSNVIDTSFETYILPIQSKEVNNIYIDSCWIEQPTVLLNSNIKIKYSIKNVSNKATKQSNITFKINQQIKSIHKVDIPAKSFIIDSFSFALAQAGVHSIELFVNDFPITYDDHFYALLNVSKNEYVLSINDENVTNHIQSVFANDAFFIFEKNNVNQINYSAINKYKFIVLNQLQDITSGLAMALKNYLQSGGILFLIPAKNINLNNYNFFLSNIGIGSFSAIKQQALSVKQLNLKESIFNGIFTDIPKNIDYPVVQQYYPFAIASQAQHYSIIPTNATTSLIHKFVVENGIVYLQSAPLDNAYTDIGSKAIYAPIVYNMAMYQKNKPSLYYTIGEQKMIGIKQDKLQKFNILKLKSSDNEFFPESRFIGNQIYLNPQNTLNKEGIYTIYKDDLPTEEALAFNYNRKESDLDFLSIDEIEQKFKYSKFTILNIKQSNIGNQVKQVKDGILLWKWCIILTLLFLLAEVLIIRFMK